MHVQLAQCMHSCSELTNSNRCTCGPAGGLEHILKHLVMGGHAKCFILHAIAEVSRRENASLTAHLWMQADVTQAPGADCLQLCAL